MLNTQAAKESLVSLFQCAPEITSETLTAYNDLEDFIEQVERLMKYNSIKQVPALFKSKGN